MQDQVTQGASAQEAEEKIQAAKKLSYAERTCNIRAERDIVELINQEIIAPNKAKDPSYPYNSASDLATQLLKLWYQNTKEKNRDIIQEGLVVVGEVQGTISLVSRVVRIIKSFKK